ncbi:MAG TPA: peptidoglycan DD-metalloendopeptidase family protein [Marmoricola sp.]|nr:peptidoglycan DD-metalloendopeptidase family protein [Marmoricola sp.]
MTLSKRLAGVLTGMLATTVLSVPVLTAPAHAQRMPQDRPSVAPSVFFPAAARRAQDLRTAGKRPGTTIKAGCGTKVVAAHPGTAYVSNSRTSGRYLVTIVTSPGRTTTYYGFMKSASVVSGQIVQAGQEIGRVGRRGSAAPKKFCSLYFAVKNNYGRNANPTRWLNRLVGQPLNSTSLFGNWGFVVASLNTLGASHTRYGGGYPTYDVRTAGQYNLLNSYAVDVAGLQEFQRPQYDSFTSMSAGTFGIYPDADTLNDTTSPFMQGNYAPTENSIIWRNSTMEFVSADFVRVPYFEGWRNMPVVLLRDRATGLTAYFMNVHNPASGVGYGDQAAHRAQAIAIERQKIIDLRATGRPVFLTGDFNDRAPAFCGITTQMLAITPDSIPSMGCAMPKSNGIDWVFAAGPARFTRYARDWKPKNMKLTDHPIVWSRAHLSE